MARMVAPAAILGAGLLAFALARAALLLDVGLWDTAEYQTVPPLLGTLHPTGFPAYAVLGWMASALLAPLGSPAFRMDLLSALLVGVAVSGTAWLVFELTRRLSLAVAAAVGLAVTPIVWHIGTRADAHALHLALLPYLLLSLVAWDGWRRAGDPRADRLLLVASVLFGIALANHRLIGFLAPGIALFVILVEPRILRRRRLLAACGGLMFGVAALLYLELPLRAALWRAPLVYGHPETFGGFWYVVLGVQFGGGMQAPFADLTGKLAALTRLGLEQVGPVALAIPAAAVIVVAHRPRYALLTIPAALLTLFFAAGYDNADIGRYYLGPALFAWSWLAVAASWLLDLLALERGWGTPGERWPRGGSPPGEAVRPAPADASPPRRTIGSRRLGLLATAIVAGLLIVPLTPLLPARWANVLADSRGSSGRLWLDGALATMAPDAVVVSWWSYSTPLWYAQLIEGRRRDVRVVDDRTRLDEGLGDVFAVIDSSLGRRPVYAIRFDHNEIARIDRRYDVTVLPIPGGPALIRIDRIRDPSA